MRMSYFVYKLVPPRPDFPADMTEEEGAIMSRHVAYWKDLTDRGVAVVVGSVVDPGGSWGLAVVEADAAEDIAALRSADPAVTTGFATVDIYPMGNTLARS
jgi:uncharacterized protein